MYNVFACAVKVYVCISQSLVRIFQFTEDCSYISDTHIYSYNPSKVSV